MAKTSEIATTLRPGEEQHGFRVEKVTPLKNLRANAYELKHIKTGARLLHVHSGDEENLFCIAFRTPPPDDTGLPHILEHSVLCGSKKYPVKHPFIEMVKMSMATFINAMTYSDKTVYPVSTNVRQDYYNLAEVYCDAVFQPILAEDTFKQEGHHFEFAKKNDTSSELIIKGIVYNEMKGAYSSPESLMGRLSSVLLFPDTVYGKDSGGDPEKIPELTFAQFKRFYETYYHPSNAFIFLYGDIPTADHLAFVGKKLDAFQGRDVPWPLHRQARWAEPRSATEKYPVGKSEALAAKTFIGLNWLVGDGADAQDTMAFTILDLILLGNQAAPLRKAIIDSKLGADLSNSGFGAGRLESVFRVGIKGSEAGRQEAFTKLVLDTLKKIADEGIQKSSVDAAFQQLSYRYLEIQSMFPLWLMDRAYSMWIYGADPLNLLRADEHLEELKRRYAADPQIFSRMITERILSNKHRLTLVMIPDAEVQSQKESAFAEKMKQTKAALKPEALAQIAKEAEELECKQAVPNSPEAIATLPQLKVTDLPPKPRHIPTSIESLDGGAQILRNDVFANGVNYLELDVNLEGLPQELYEYLPIYGDCVRKLGAAGQNYERMAERVSSHTGGVSFSSSCTTHASDAARCLRRGHFSLKWLNEKTEPALAVLKDLIFDVDFSDEARFKDILAQSKAWQQTSIVQRGLGLAVNHAARGLNRVGYLNEIMGGVPQVRLSQAMGDRYAKDHGSVVGKLEAIRKFMLNSRRFTASFTGSDSVYPTLNKTLSSWLSSMKSDPIVDQTFDFQNTLALREGLAAPADVAFCVQVIPAPHQSDPSTSLLSVASRLLSLTYMWDEIRVKGGAYGGGCGHGSSGCMWYFYSYRDPSITKTLATFKGLIDYVHKSDWPKVEIERAIIGTAKDACPPIRPDYATGASLWRHITGETPEIRERKHAAILGVTGPNMKQTLIELFEREYARGSVCVLSSREKLEAANKENADLRIEDVIEK